jgi:nitrate reductase gamma subunit
VAGVPLLVTLHIALAWVILAMIPFTRLIHMFFFPLQYLWRRPQTVVWLTERGKSPARATQAAGAPAPRRGARA